MSTDEHEVLELFAEVNALFKEQEDVVSQAKEVLKTFEQFRSNYTLDGDYQIDEISTSKLHIAEDNPIDGIYFDGELLAPEIIQEFLAVVNETLVKVNASHEDVSVGSQQEPLHIKSLTAEHLNVKFINGIPVENFVFLTNNTLRIDGTLLLDQPIVVRDTVEFVDEFIGAGILNGSEIIETLHISGNLNVPSINRIPWNEFIGGIVFRNLPNLLQQIQVTGVRFEGSNIEDLVENKNAVFFPECDLRERSSSGKSE